MLCLRSQTGSRLEADLWYQRPGRWELPYVIRNPEVGDDKVMSTYCRDQRLCGGSRRAGQAIRTQRLRVGLTPEEEQDRMPNMWYHAIHHAPREVPAFDLFGYS